MGNRGQKRTELMDDMPADKRACSSLEFRPSSSSNSSVQIHIKSANSGFEPHDGDMDTSSSASQSGRSEGEAERDSAYGSCDSDTEQRHSSRNYNHSSLSSLREYQRQRSSGDHSKYKRILSSLTDDVEQSAQLAALTELCELLSFTTENSVSGFMSDSLAPILVKLAKHESNPDIMLLAIRAMTYLCDVFPRASGFLVRHDAVPALCDRLLGIEYLDVAEQCLQALEKISRDQPLACLQSGAMIAVLNYIDFFSTSIQRTALSTVLNICKKLPSECPLPFMEAVPLLCNLLQYDDRQLVENVASCLIKIAERVCHSSEMLDELCKHGLVQQVVSLINMNSRTTLSQPIHTGLIGLLLKLAAGSAVAVRTLFELNISGILKDILSSYDLAHGVSFPHMVDGQCNQVHEILKLLNELLPRFVGDGEDKLQTSKETLLGERPEFLQKFGVDVLPTVIQVVNSGANTYVCYGSLAVTNKIVFFCKPDMLLELLNGTNISSFLAGVFTRKDHHVLTLALHITKTILQKLSDAFLDSFIKEGVFFAIDALLASQKCSEGIVSVAEGAHSSDSSQKFSLKDDLRCLCHAFDSSRPFSSSDGGTCKIEQDSVHNLAEHIRTSYFISEKLDSKKGLTDIFQKLKAYSALLDDLVHSSDCLTCPQDEEKLYSLLHEIMESLSGREPISTFEFVESGIVKSLMDYLSIGLYSGDKLALNHLDAIGKKFQVFARLSFTYPEVSSQDMPLLILIRKLQKALSSVENFPVIASHVSKSKHSYATVPNGRCIAYPCLRVRFVREEADTCLCDYPDDVVTVDPFASLEAIEGFLWPKVGTKRMECIKSIAEAIGEMEMLPHYSPANGSSTGGGTEVVEPASMSSGAPRTQVLNDDMLRSELVIISKTRPGETMGLHETHDDSRGKEEVHSSPVAERNATCNFGPRSEEQPASVCSSKEKSPKLLFFLGGRQLDQASTLYQAILHQHAIAENDIITRFWGQVYTVTYQRAPEPRQSHLRECLQHSQQSCSSNKIGMSWQSFFSSIFTPKLAPVLEKPSSTYDILCMLKCLDGLNKFAYHLLSQEKTDAFAEGRFDNLGYMKVEFPKIQQHEFVNNKLTEKLEQQMRDPLAVSTGAMPDWCNQLMVSCPFLFGFEVKCKYFRLAAFGQQQAYLHPQSPSNSGSPRERRINTVSFPRKKFLVSRNRVMDSAFQMMDLYVRDKVVLEVEYNEEVGTGLGPTLEFYTLVSHEFQKPGLGLWREDYNSSTSRRTLSSECSEIVVTDYGLFPRPWSSESGATNATQFTEVIKKFVLLGQLVAKALQDGRVLDLPLSKAFYKLILGQQLNVYDIQTFDPELGRALLEFQAFVDRRKKVCGSFCEETVASESCYRDARIEDLCLDFTLPGYPDYSLISGSEHPMVNMNNLEEYVSLVVDATINSGISRQVKAFRSGFNQVFPIKHLQIYTEEELEHLLCGEHDCWASHDLMDHIKFDHGYTASSVAVINLLEIIHEFNPEERRAFLQFVTGAPRLPPGGLAALNPKLTIVRKHCSKWVDTELPSVMTCANYLKLPAYSSKEMMREKLLYAIMEGQGSFHLS